MRAALIICALVALALPAASLGGSVAAGCGQTATGEEIICPTPVAPAAVTQDGGRGLWCSQKLVARSDGTLGSALDEAFTDLPLATAGRFAWYVVGVGLTCDAPSGAATGRVVDQTGRRCRACMKMTNHALYERKKCQS